MDGRVVGTELERVDGRMKLEKGNDGKPHD